MSRSKGIEVDVILAGAGIMSSTLGVLLQIVEPDWSVVCLERLDRAAAESSDAWNNAGTGHSAFCELNYTPEKADGSIDLRKAKTIAEQFEISKEFWASLVESKVVSNPGSFIKQVPHLSFVTGEKDIEFLRHRFQGLSQHHLFSGMRYSENSQEIASWIPLMMEGRDTDESVAATRMDIGTDVNFGSLARAMLTSLEARGKFELRCAHEIRDIERGSDGLWHVQVRNATVGERRWYKAPFVFIGAGGGSLPLLERSEIPEAAGYGGFPVSGQWLVCENPEVVKRHAAKVYGKAAVGAPPMSVPHLDTRVIGGERALLFGPYAGFSTRFLKQGSFLDLPGSITLDNVGPMISAGLQNLSLTRYLLDQVTQSEDERLHTLREFLPLAKAEDWRLETAGQRVQIIKRDEHKGGVLEFGTEVVSSADGTIAAMLGASPGASTSVSIMLQVLQRCFPEAYSGSAWRERLRPWLPNLERSLAQDREAAAAARQRSTRWLELG